jgi:antibiotic biosynthesis monooxygenase (ABM) superfamily enzyme
MTVFLVRTYTVKPDKLKEHDQWGKKLVTLMKKKPALFNGVKSMRVFSNKYGGCIGGFTAMWGFENINSIQGWEKGFSEIPEELTLRSEFMDLLVPGSFSACIWESVKTLNRKTKTKPKQAKK